MLHVTVLFHLTKPKSTGVNYQPGAMSITILHLCGLQTDQSNPCDSKVIDRTTILHVTVLFYLTKSKTTGVNYQPGAMSITILHLCCLQTDQSYPKVIDRTCSRK
jgi:hypothetical protein